MHLDLIGMGVRVKRISIRKVLIFSATAALVVVFQNFSSPQTDAYVNQSMVDRGQQIYRAWNGSDYALRTLEGPNVFLSYDPGRFNYTNDDLKRALFYLEKGAINYKAYMKLAPAGIGNHSAYPNVRKFAASIVPNTCGAGCGASGKAEILDFGSGNESRNLFYKYKDHPLAWKIGVYEFGRSHPDSSFAVIDYLPASPTAEVAQRSLYSAFPHFLAWTTLNDLGLPDSMLTPSYMPELNEWNQGLWPGQLSRALIGRQFIDYYYGLKMLNEMPLNGSLAVVLHGLRMKYGHQFMIYFFWYARQLIPASSPIEALCNTQGAANLALAKLRGSSVQNEAGQYLVSSFKYPANCTGLPLSTVEAEASQIISPAVVNGEGVGNINGGNSSAVKLTVRVASSGTYFVNVIYRSGETRYARITNLSNGNQYFNLTSPNDGNWNSPKVFRNSLSLKAGDNILLYKGTTGWAPDIDRIVITQGALPTYKPPVTLALNRFFSSSKNDTWVDTNSVPPESSYSVQSVLGRMIFPVMNTPSGTLPLFSCRIGPDHFVSKRSDCEGQVIVSKIGYVYSTAASGRVAIYRCRKVYNHFVALDPNCEGATSEGLLGFILQ